MEKIVERDSLELYKEDLAKYGIEVNRRRMVPDMRDGLKLVQRRILYAMYKDQPCMEHLVKTASVIGSTLGKYHPHGDSSVQDAIKPMANWFDSKLPLIRSESNMGSMQGDGAAAPRYTEIMLSQFAKECVIGELKDSKFIVDWSPNFDNRFMEPDYLPVSVPLLLINGTSGIGVGMKSEVPKHNVNEVIDATINLIRNPNYQVILIPDQCMPCEIIDTNWKVISNTGRGKYTARAIIDIETDKNGNSKLVIKSTPSQVYFDKGESGGGVKYDILNMIKEGKLPQITKIDEESHKNDMRIVIHLRKGSDPNYVRSVLYKNTRLQNTYAVNFEVLNGIELVRMSYKQYLQFFIDQRKITKFRLYCNKLQYAKTKYHEMDAYIKAIESGDIDNIIQMIKKQKSTDDTVLIEYLIKKLDITDIQAKFIINSNIKTLSIAYLNKYKNESKKYHDQEKVCLEKITNDNLIENEIIEELETFKAKYGSKRLCKVIKQSQIDNIPAGEFGVVVTENNFIRKLPLNTNIGACRGDNPVHICKADNTENVLLFTNAGRVHKIPVHKIPLCDKNNPGTDLRILVKTLTSPVIKMVYEPDLVKASKSLKAKTFVAMVTEGNYTKKIDLEDLLNVPPSGIIYTKLNENDRVKDIVIAPDNMDVIIYSERKALRISMADLPHYKRASAGVYAMNTSTKIDGMSIIEPTATDIIVVTEKGKANKFNVSGLAKSARNKSGSSVIKLGKDDTIHSVYGVNDNNELLIVTKNGRNNIKVSDIPSQSSVSGGNKIISAKGDIILRVDVM